VKKAIGRLFPIAVIGVGLFFWKGGLGLFATDRELIWRVPGPYSTVRKVEVQIYDGDELLKREEWMLPSGLSVDPTDKVRLKEGAYLTNLLVWREGKADAEAYRIKLQIAGEGPFVLKPQ
jgi:hypothetical protein